MSSICTYVYQVVFPLHEESGLKKRKIQRPETHFDHQICHQIQDLFRYVVLLTTKKGARHYTPCILRAVKISGSLLQRVKRNSRFIALSVTDGSLKWFKDRLQKSDSMQGFQGRKFYVTFVTQGFQTPDILTLCRKTSSPEAYTHDKIFKKMTFRMPE